MVGSHKIVTHIESIASYRIVQLLEVLVRQMDPDKRPERRESWERIPQGEFSTIAPNKQFAVRVVLNETSLGFGTRVMRFGSSLSWVHHSQDFGA